MQTTINQTIIMDSSVIRGAPIIMHDNSHDNSHDNREKHPLTKLLS